LEKNWWKIFQLNKMGNVVVAVVVAVVAAVLPFSAPIIAASTTFK